MPICGPVAERWLTARWTSTLWNGPRYEIRRGQRNGVEWKLTACGDGTFSLVFYRKGKEPEYHLDLKEQDLERFSDYVRLPEEDDLRGNCLR